MGADNATERSTYVVSAQLAENSSAEGGGEGAASVQTVVQPQDGKQHGKQGEPALAAAAMGAAVAAGGGGNQSTSHGQDLVSQLKGVGSTLGSALVAAADGVFGGMGGASSSSEANGNATAGSSGGGNATVNDSQAVVQAPPATFNTAPPSPSPSPPPPHRCDAHPCSRCMHLPGCECRVAPPGLPGGSGASSACPALGHHPPAGPCSGPPRLTKPAGTPAHR